MQRFLNVRTISWLGPAVALLLIAATALLVSNGKTKPNCGPTTEARDLVELVVTGRNHDCEYTLQVGDKFAVITEYGDNWGDWPPKLSNPSLVSVEGQSVGSLGPSPSWEIDYKATRAGKLVLQQRAITIMIQEPGCGSSRSC